MGVLVVGSFMTDLVARTKRVPSPGQTVVGESFEIFMGGKGANQAIAAKRCDVKTFMVGALGDDAFGLRFLDFFQKSGFKKNHIVIKKNEISGIGHIVVNEKTGQNQIIILPGANLLFTVDDLMPMGDLFQEVEIVVNQLEMDDSIIVACKNFAQANQKLYLLNPAPYKPLDDQILKGIDYFTPNETELAAFVGKKSLDTDEEITNACKELIKKGVKNIIATLGERGSIHCSNNGCKFYEAFKVSNVIDTVAAGDAFNGTLAAMLAKGFPIEKAIIYANASGALTVMKKGAIPSIPTLFEIERFILKQHNNL